MGSHDWELQRIQAGRPRFGSELNGNFTPFEAGACPAWPLPITSIQHGPCLLLPVDWQPRCCIAPGGPGRPMA